jgi:hypothetical protein
VVVQKPYTTQIKSDTDYNVFLALNGSNVILTVDNRVTLTYTFAPRVDVYGLTHGLKEGMVGLGANNGKAKIDNVVVQRLAPVLSVNKTVDFSSGTTTLLETPLSGTWTLEGGRYEGVAGATPAIGLTSVNVASSSIVDFSATFKTTGEGGFVYDQYSAEDFKYLTISAGKITLGHRTPKGWFTDVTFSNAAIVTGTDYTLGLTLKNNSVSVLLNNQLVLSKTYNALVTDGNFGLFSRSGATSFDAVTFKTDDTTLAQNLVAAAAPAGQAEAASWVIYDQLDGIIEEAKDRWAESLGTNIIGQAALDQVTFQIVNFGDMTLGRAIGASVLIDLDAAGWGWFVDTTPVNDVEFGLSLSEVEKMALATSPAFGRMDLLTVVMHEMGHVLGFEDLDPNAGALMSGTLDACTRRLADSTPDSPSLVQMGGVAGSGVDSLLWGAKDSKASWLEDLLVDLAGKKDNPFDPTGKIKISIPGFNGGTKKK